MGILSSFCNYLNAKSASINAQRIFSIEYGDIGSCLYCSVMQGEKPYLDKSLDISEFYRPYMSSNECQFIYEIKVSREMNDSERFILGRNLEAALIKKFGVDVPYVRKVYRITVCNNLIFYQRNINYIKNLKPIDMDIQKPTKTNKNNN